MSVAASASRPRLERFGPWEVVSIVSLSGTEGDDASVILAQGEYPNIVQARWTQGGPIVVSINIDRCVGDQDFEASYSVEPKRLLQLSRRDVQARLRADVIAWLGQANLVCGSIPAIGAIKIKGLDAAASDFYYWLRYYVGSPDAARYASAQ
jgi:hypothetical protein